MQITPPGIVGMVFAALAGAAYVVTGDDDFAVEVHRPLPEVYAAFSRIKTFGSGLRDEGFDVPKVTVSRPSPHEIVFTAPSANPGQPSRIAFACESAPGSVVTSVTAAIDVPPIAMGVDGEDKFLSEEKVEARFREAIGEMAKQLDQGNSPETARTKLTMLIDMVALASHPAEFKKAMDRVERLQAVHNRLSQDKAVFGPDQIERGYAEGYDPAGIDDPASGYPEEFR